jgi:glycine cleavage system H protein
MDYPSNYRYTREHEWISVSGDTGTVGITDYAQKALGDIVYLDLPKVGDQFEGAQQLGTVESVKAVSEIFSPASGEVVDVNADLANQPELLNKDPHGAAWLVKLRLKDPAEVNNLMSAEQYQAYVAEEAAEH